jgi:adenosylcobinamide kinase / adenosylcobinamide-phosphate guanylyltransferase
MFTFLTGGARSGKSALAVRTAIASQFEVVFFATAEALDEEMADRIRRHQAERPDSWTTVEAPVGLLAAVSGVSGDSGVSLQPCIIIDCLSLWVTNLMFTPSHQWAGRVCVTDAEVDREIEAAAQALAVVLGRRTGPTIVVTNEVGLGIVPDNPLARRYRDVLGRVNATLAASSDEAFFCAAGRVLRLEAPSL